MIRRDYILRMIEEFAQALARIRSLKRSQRWTEASAALDAEFERLIGDDGQAVARLSETELLARLMQDGPTHVVRDKTLLLTTLLKEAGDVAAAEDRVDESRECYLKALHLLLDVLARGEVFECSEFLPKVEMLKEALQGTPLPPRTHAMLMQHHERTGDSPRPRTHCLPCWTLSQTTVLSWSSALRFTNECWRRATRRSRRASCLVRKSRRG